MKKFLTIIGIVCCALLVGTVIACGGKGGDATIDDVKIELVGADGGTTLSWQKVKGVSFEVYRAPSRYSEYEKIAGGITDGVYADGDRFGYYKVVATDADGKTLKTFDGISEEAELFGGNTYIFSTDDDPQKVNSVIADVYSRQYDNSHSEFTSRRYGFLFKPGEYDNSIRLDTGYYTTFSGLGLSPNDTSIRTLSCRNGANTNALINFWRGAENLTVRSDTTWAVSQGAFLRSVKIIGNLAFHDGGGYASGGLFADGYVSGTVNSGSQQQWLSRNCAWSGWQGNVWNMCFSGVKNAPTGIYPNYKYTVEESSTVREKPFLVFDKANGYRIAVPGVRENAVGCSWTDGNIDTRIERYIAMENIYFARAERDTAATLNAALQSGKNIVFTPGIYELDSPIVVDKNDAVLLGIGLATLRPTNGNACLTVENCTGTGVCGILFDAGEKESECLASIGTADSAVSGAYLHDCFFRVGGATDKATNVKTCLKIYADGTTCDNLWIWRADHGAGVGWTRNNSDNGIEVYGDDVTIYALMSEHHKKHNAVWYGQRGKVFFYQSEIAYDVPSQKAWTDGERNGYASFKVDDGVTEFTAKGLGIYANFHNAGVVLDSGMIVPNADGITVEHICTVKLNGDGAGAIINVINDYGGSVGASASDPATRFVTEYKV